VTELTGRVALVTGGTRGIGHATAAALAAGGATVVLTGRDGNTARERADDVAKQHGVRVDGVALDVTDGDAITAVVRGVAAEHGRLDIVVANAGILEEGVIGMLRPDHIERQMTTNVTGTLLTVQAAARVMGRKPGAIVVLSSIVAEHPGAGQSAYAASKAAVSAIARSAAKELGRRGIRVNAVAPGVIPTDLVAHLPETARDQAVDSTALRRLGTPDEVAAVIRFLVGDAASYVTGQVIGVDGGLSV
jgi:3-oxoacyl-[acyl-carrier protein] reductase